MLVQVLYIQYEYCTVLVFIDDRTHFLGFVESFRNNPHSVCTYCHDNRLVLNLSLKALSPILLLIYYSSS
jgi:hypothetical protein